MAHQPYKRIERISNGQWEEVKFEEIRLGDVFRVFEPRGDETLYTALSRAHPVVDEPGNWSIQVERAEPPTGLSPHDYSNT